MDKQIALTSQKIENLEKRVNEVEKNNAVIISKIDDIKEDSGEMKRLLSQINRRLINGS